MTDILSVVVGSRAHGLNLEGSDNTDVMVIALPTAEELLGMGNPEWTKVVRDQPEGVKSQPGDTDMVIHSVKKWMRLAVKGNPTILLPMFVDKKDVITSSIWGDAIRENLPEQIVCKDFFYPFLGYMAAQKERLYGQRGQMRVKRPELVDAFGYDTKYAMHTLRLGMQGIEILMTGRLTMPMNSFAREVLMKVRRGEVKFEELREALEETEEMLKEAFKNSKLRATPNMEFVNKLMLDIHVSVVPSWMKGGCNG